MFTLKPILSTEDPDNPLFEESECAVLISTYKIFYAKRGFVPPWTGYFIIQNERVVGSCGFAETLQNNTVEIAYWTFSRFEGKGVATFACSALIDMTRNVDPAILITAKTAPEENASTHILRKAGFVQTKIVQDHEIGDAWFWELPRTI